MALLAASRVAAQPGSIVTHPLQVSGPSTIDSAGNTYTTTAAFAGAFVSAGAAQTQPGAKLCEGFLGLAPCNNAYIIKVNASGVPVFATFLGGAADDVGTTVAVDAGGNVYVAGNTEGSFPTTAGSALAASITSTTFAAKLSADGTKFIYSTYLPDTMAGVTGIAVDSQGDAVIAGYTTANHACVIRLSADGSGFIYSTVLAGSNNDYPSAVAVDAAGDAFVTGNTRSPDFPVSAGVVQSQLAGLQNAFLTKLDAAGNIVFSTFLGGSFADAGNAVQVDAGGNAYIAGTTSSLNFPTTAGSFEPAASVPAWSTSPVGFVAKIAPDGRALAYGSYAPFITTLALGASGDAYVSGLTGAFFPVTASGPQPCVGGGSDELGSDFVAHLNAQGAIVDATYLEDGFAPSGMGVLADGSVVVAGELLSAVQFGGAGWVAAPCMTPTVVHSATFSASYAVPGEIVTFAGFGIGPRDGVSAQRGAEGLLPTMLGGVEVLFDGTPAPVLYAQSGQVNAQAPFELSGQTSTVVTLKYNGQTFGPVNVAVNFAYPGLYRLEANVSAQAYAVNQDGTLNSASNPASPGSVVAFWGTGFGSTSPACATGGLNAPGPANLAADLSVQMIGAAGESYAVQYAGGAPTLACGVEQINMQVPTGQPPGALLVSPQVTITSGGAMSFVQNQVGSIIYIK
jgi:uncharacterized protein (TIGR03437 family)